MIRGKRVALVNGVWQDQTVDNVHQALVSNQPLGTKILFIQNDVTPDGEIIQAFEKFAQNDQCRRAMIETYGFPSYLFSEGWTKSNGFAGGRRIVNLSGGTAGFTSWFRILIKKMEHPVSVAKAYKWIEMTFFIHQLHAGDVTIVCCSYLDKFFIDVLNELNHLPPGTVHDWKHLQSILVRHVILSMDTAVWDYSNAIRYVEKNRPKTQNSLRSFVDFPRLHDLLRHTVHCTELLEVTTSTLREWIHKYHADQESLLRSNTTALQSIEVPYHDELLDSLQLIRNLTKRSSSNEARLRNEINLAFNVVAQQDTKAVRIISFVTLAFLPATFVSTLFSMSFFNYQHDGSGWAVASDVWIYFVIAVPLTAMTIIAWVWGPVWAEKGYLNWKMP